MHHSVVSNKAAEAAGAAGREINATEAGTTSPGVSLNCARRLGRLVRPL